LLEFEIVSSILETNGDLPHQRKILQALQKCSCLGVSSIMSLFSLLSR
jgi:hypothetical protein